MLELIWEAAWLLVTLNLSHYHRRQLGLLYKAKPEALIERISSLQYSRAEGSLRNLFARVFSVYMSNRSHNY
ncbi:MAG: hypothetical protein AAFX97_12025, partial [Pseudomonadota bacterium]